MENIVLLFLVFIVSCTNFNPHATIIVSSSSADYLEGKIGFTTSKFID